MAQFAIDPADGAGVLNDFTNRYGSKLLTLVDDAGTPALLASGWVDEVVSYDPAGQVTDFEIVFRARRSGSGGNQAPGVAGRIAAGGTFYSAAGLSDNDLLLDVYLAGARSNLSIGYNQPVNHLTYTWYRFRISGSSLKFRLWADGSAEPTTWNAEVTNTQITAAGFVGLYNRTFDDVWYAFVGIGTNGDPAPTGPVSTGVTGTADHQASTATHTATGSVSSTITGTADHQAATATQSATGTREVTATGNHQAQAAAHSASGSVGSAITGTASHEAATATHSATGEREITGTSNSQAARATQSATGLRVVTGDAANQASTATHSAQGTIGNAFVGSGDHQAQTSTHAATGTREVTGTSTGQAQTATHNAMAVREIIGSGTHAANDATQTSTGTISKTITGTASHQAQRATHQASSRPVLLRPIKNTSLVEVTPAYSIVDISPTYTIAVQ